MGTGTPSLSGSGPGTAAGSAAPEPARHYSTGRLTRAQAAVVNRWRARLREDRPVDGQRLVSAEARLLGATDRPPASCSDMIAAAVEALLDTRPPQPLDLARYAYAGMRAQQAAAQLTAAGQEEPRAADEDAAPLYPPVSVYLPARLARLAEDLRSAAYGAVVDVLTEIRRQAFEDHPGSTDTAAAARNLAIWAEMAARGLPYCKKVPRGTLARMAIDQWAGRDPDQVAVTAVAYAADVHDQPHRARCDMQLLRR